MQVALGTAERSIAEQVLSVPHPSCQAGSLLSPDSLRLQEQEPSSQKPPDPTGQGRKGQDPHAPVSKRLCRDWEVTLHWGNSIPLSSPPLEQACIPAGAASPGLHTPRKGVLRALPCPRPPDLPGVCTSRYSQAWLCQPGAALSSQRLCPGRRSHGQNSPRLTQGVA